MIGAIPIGGLGIASTPDALGAFELELFEDGTAGNAYTVTSGIADGGGFSGTGSMTYTTLFAVEGTQGVEVDLTVSSSWGRRIAFQSGPATSQIWLIDSFKYPATPANTTPVMSVRTSGTNQAQVAHTSADKLVLRDGVSAVVTSTTTLVPGTTYTVGWQIDVAGNTQQFRLYSAAGVLLEASGTGAFTGTDPDEMLFGVIGAPGITGKWYHDRVGYSTFDWIDPPAAGVDSRAVTVLASLGLNGSETSKKITVASARGVAGLNGSETSKKVAPASARGVAGLNGSETSKKVARPAVTGALGLNGSETSRKVAVAAVVGALGLNDIFSRVKLASVTVVGALGLSARSGAAKVAPVSARAVAGLNGSETSRKVAPAGATGALGATSSPTVRKVSTPALRGVLGAVGTVVARKVSTPSSSATLGLAARTVVGKVKPASITTALGLSDSATVRKVQGISSLGTIGLGDRISRTAARAIAVREFFGLSGVAGSKKVTPAATSGALGLNGSETSRKVAVASARGTAGLAGSAGSRKVGKAASTGSLGATSTPAVRKVGVASVRAALGASSFPTVRKVASAGARGAVGFGSVIVKALQRPISVFTGLGLGTRAGASTRKPPAQGSWWSLVDFLADARALAAETPQLGTSSCPSCGTPLSSGPEGELFCHFDGWPGLTSGSTTRPEPRHEPDIVSCPNDGEPLVETTSGLVCPFDGWRP